MSETFVPRDYLKQRELKLLKLTNKRIPQAESQSELIYYEKVLDVLTIIAIERGSIKTKKEINY